MTEKKRKSWTR